MSVQKNHVSVANRVYGMAYTTLANFFQGVHDALSANAAVFPTPPITLANQQTAIAALNTAIIAWGPPGNRGSHASLVNLHVARNAARNMLEVLAVYVASIAQSLSPLPADQKATILLGGMRPKDDGNALPPPGPVQNPRQIVFQSLLGTKKVYLKWAKPLVAPGQNSKPPFYNITAAGVQVGQTTKTSFLFQGVSSATVIMEITPVNAAGVGAPSGPIPCQPQ